MSILKRANPPATEQRPLYIKFTKVTRTGKDNGVTLFDTEAKFSDGEVFHFPENRITIYDNSYGPPGRECPVTNPCMVYLQGQYWEARDVPSGDVVANTPQEVPKAEPKPFYGGGGGKSGGGGRGYTPQTEANLMAALGWTINRCKEIDREHGIPPAVTFDKILGCASMVEWDTPAEQPQQQDSGGGDVSPFPVDASDVPFHHMAPMGGVL